MGGETCVLLVSAAAAGSVGCAAVRVGHGPPDGGAVAWFVLYGEVAYDLEARARQRVEDVRALLDFAFYSASLSS